MKVGMVATLLHLHQKLWKIRKEKPIENKKFDMKGKVNDQKYNSREPDYNLPGICFTTITINITVYNVVRR